MRLMTVLIPLLLGWMGGLYMASWYLAATVASGLSIRTQYIPNTWAWRTLSLVRFLPSTTAEKLLSKKPIIVRVKLFPPSWQ